MYSVHVPNFINNDLASCILHTYLQYIHTHIHLHAYNYILYTHTPSDAHLHSHPRMHRHIYHPSTHAHTHIHTHTGTNTLSCLHSKLQLLIQLVAARTQHIAQMTDSLSLFCPLSLSLYISLSLLPTLPVAISLFILVS